MKLTELQLTLLLTLLATLSSSGQSTTTERYKEQRWNLNTNINLPAAVFHLANRETSQNTNGYLELFSSLGLGVSINYGQATFVRDVVNDKLLDEFTQFSNMIGLQFGILYNSHLAQYDDASVNSFSLYSGINILDLQLGGGYELGTPFIDSNGWFLTVSYGIPVYKLTGGSSYMFKKKSNKKIVGWTGDVAAN